MNKVILMGRLTADPDIRYTDNKDKTCIAHFTLAINYDEENVDFIRCVAFGKTAELAERCLTKGKKILVEGRWHTGSYENEDGDMVYTNECTISRVEFCEKREDDKDEPPKNKKSGTRKSGTGSGYTKSRGKK